MSRNPLTTQGRAENKAVADRTLVKFRGPKALPDNIKGAHNASLAQNFLRDKLPRLRKLAANKTNLESSICSASKCLQTGKRF
jgi:hypothetical protein